MGRYSGILGSGRYAGVLPSAGGGAWEGVSPTVQRRKKADGSYEYRPKAKFAGAEPGLAGEAESFALPYGAPNLDELKLLGGQVASRVKEGIASFTDLPDLASVAVEQLLPAGVTVKPGARDEAFRLPGVLGDARDSVAAEYAGAKDILAEKLAARGVSPVASALADTGLEATAIAADPTNFLPSVGALKAGKRMGRYAGLADDVLKAAPPPSVLDDVLEEAVERGPLKAPDPELAARFPEAQIDTRDVFEGPMLPAGTRNRLPPVEVREGGRDVRAFDISTGKFSIVPEAEAGPLAHRDLRVDLAAAPLKAERVPSRAASNDNPGLGRPPRRAPIVGVERFDVDALTLSFDKDAGRELTTAEIRDLFPDLPPTHRVDLEGAANAMRPNLQRVRVRFWNPDDPRSGAARGVADLFAKRLGGVVGPPSVDASRALAGAANELAAGQGLVPSVKANDLSAFRIERQSVLLSVANDRAVPPSVLARHPDVTAEIAVTGAVGERGFLKIPTGPSFLGRWFTKDGEFHALGELKGWAFDRSNARNLEIAAGGRRVTDNLRDFSVAFEEAMPQMAGRTRDEVADYLMAGLRGDHDLRGVPPELRDAVGAMRAHLDELSGGYLPYEDLSARLKQTIKNNEGSYIPRAFQAFEDPDFPARVDPLSPKHDPKEAWRWEGFMKWAQGQRDADASQIYNGAAVLLPDGRRGRVTQVGANGQVSVDLGNGSLQDLPRADLRNTAGTATWTDEQITAYGQRLLYRDPDAFLSSAAGSVGREGRGNLISRIVANPAVDDLPESIAREVRQGRLSLDAGAERARSVPGWWESYVAQQEGLPRELDDMLGLYRDPAMRYRAGAIRAIHDQAVYKLHLDLREKGVPAGLFVEEGPGRPGQYVRVGGKGPLAEVYASPGVAAVVRGTENAAKQVGALMASWQKVNGGVKLAKTALNFPAGPMRNLVAWVPQLMAGGHFVAAFNPVRAIKLMPYQMADKLGTQRGALTRLAKRMADSVELADGSRLGERWAMDLKDMRPEIDFLYRHGVLGESAHADDLRHYSGVLGIKEEKPRGKRIKATLAAHVNVWSSGDDLGKHIYYRAELQNLLWANGKVKALESLPADYFTRRAFRAEAEEAARRVRLVTPTSSMIAPGVKKLRDAPIAAFPGWTAEVFRNAKEQIRLGVTDLRNPNPRMKVLGAKRLAGFLGTAAAASSYGIGKAFDATSGAQDPEAIRSFVPPWSVDSQLAVTDLDLATGKARYVDLSALIPQAAFMDSASTILRSAQDPTDDSWDAAIDAIQGAVQPFVEEEIVVTALLDFMRNKQMKGGGVPQGLNMLRNHEHKLEGYEVYTPGAMTKTQAKQTIYHFYKAAAPAGVIGLQGERMLRAAANDNPEVRAAFAELTNYDRELSLEDEAWGMAGLRFSTVDIGRSVARQGSDYTRRRTDASALYGRRKKMGPSQQAHPELVLRAKEEANQMGRAAHEQMARVVADAMRLGFPPHQVRRWLKDGNISQNHISSLMLDAQRLLKGEEPMSYIPVVR